MTFPVGREAYHFQYPHLITLSPSRALSVFDLRSAEIVVKDLDLSELLPLVDGVNMGGPALQYTTTAAASQQNHPRWVGFLYENGDVYIIDCHTVSIALVKHYRYEVAGLHQDNPVLAIQFQRDLFICYVTTCSDPEEDTHKHPDYVEVFRCCPRQVQSGQWIPASRYTLEPGLRLNGGKTPQMTKELPNGSIAVVFPVWEVETKYSTYLRVMFIYSGSYELVSTPIKLIDKDMASSLFVADNSIYVWSYGDTMTHYPADIILQQQQCQQRNYRYDLASDPIFEHRGVPGVLLADITTLSGSYPALVNIYHPKYLTKDDNDDDSFQKISATATTAMTATTATTSQHKERKPEEIVWLPQDIVPPDLSLNNLVIVTPRRFYVALMDYNKRRSLNKITLCLFKT